MEDREDESERRFWGAAVRAMWSALIVLGALGALAAANVLLGWWPYLPLSILGLLSGIALAAALRGSAHGRERTLRALAVFTLPLLAALITLTGAADEAAFRVYSARLTPLLVHASAGLLGVVCLAAVWQGWPPPAVTDTPPASAQPAGKGKAT